jgi:hypothetical protein
MARYAWLCLWVTQLVGKPGAIHGLPIKGSSLWCLAHMVAV